MKIQSWWVALTVTFGMVVLTSCQSVAAVDFPHEPPEVLLVKIVPLDTTMFEQRLKVDLRVRNPNDYDLNVTGLDFTLHLNEQRLARGLTNQSSTIPRLSDAVLSVETTTSILDVVRQLLNFRHDQDLIYQMSGVVHVQGTRLPFENKGVLMEARPSSDSPTGS
ncbi:MAG: LEA type 2 family protein [Nitrospirales bacterium]